MDRIFAVKMTNRENKRVSNEKKARKENEHSHSSIHIDVTILIFMKKISMKMIFFVMLQIFALFINGLILIGIFNVLGCMLILYA